MVARSSSRKAPAVVAAATLQAEEAAVSNGQVTPMPRVFVLSDGQTRTSPTTKKME